MSPLSSENSLKQCSRFHKLLGYYFFYRQLVPAAPVMCASHTVATHTSCVHFIMCLKTDFWYNTTQNILPSKQVHEAANSAITESYTGRSTVFSMAKCRDMTQNCNAVTVRIPYMVADSCLQIKK